jgi:glucose-6-phosphate dehydrogenase assembly protein OpcA
MSAATTASFLEGQGIPVDLPKIEGELAKLWGPAAALAGGPDVQNPNVTRIVLANLVVECLDGRGESLGPVLETVMARFPCRAIVVCGSNDPDRRIAADISALCHLPAPGLPQVCSERIVLRAGPNAIDLIPGAVRPLLETDLPLLLWWTGDPRRHEPLFRDLADECSRLVLDLGDPGASSGALRLGLDRSLCACSRDSTWFGLTRWRELVAQFFDPLCHHDRLGHIIAVHIEARSSDPTHPARLAIWMAAWLAGQLHWQPERRSFNQASAPDGGTELVARFVGPGGEVAVSIVSRPSSGSPPAVAELIAVTVTSRGNDSGAEAFETFRLRRPTPGSPSVVMEAEATGLCRLPHVVQAPELDPARRVAATLEASCVDFPFEKALPIALWLLESAESRSS